MPVAGKVGKLNDSLVSGLMSDEICERAQLSWLLSRRPSHIKLNFLPRGWGGVLVGPGLVAGRIQEEEAEDVDVPQAVHPGHEPTGVLQRPALPDVLVPLGPSFLNLADDEANDSEGSGEHSRQHQKFEPPDNSLVVEPPDPGHVLEAGSPVGDGEEDLPDHVAEEDEVEAGRDARKDDEAERKVGSDVSHPDWVEWVLCWKICSLVFQNWELCWLF